MLKFNDVENHLFYAVIYGLMYYKTDKANIKKEDAQKVLGDDLYFDLLEIEPETLLDKSLFGHFERCYAINQMLAKHDHFLNVETFLGISPKKRLQEKMKSLEICLLA